MVDRMDVLSCHMWSSFVLRCKVEMFRGTEAVDFHLWPRYIVASSYVKGKVRVFW